MYFVMCFFFCFKQKTAYDVRISDWSSDVCSSDLALGVDRLEVARRPTVAVFTTGDELGEPGMPLQPGQIYNSNRELLMGLLRADGIEPVAWPTLPDDPARMTAMLRDAASSFDLVVTCGAVSAGEKDHIPDIVREHGPVPLRKVRTKPRAGRTREGEECVRSVRLRGV